MDSDLKVCNRCGVAKSLDEFYVSKGGRDGRRPECKVCNLAARRLKYAADPRPHIERVMRWRDANRERYLERQRSYTGTPQKKASNRKSHLKRKYGLTLEAFDALLASQGDGCAICGTVDADNVDHDHATGAVRGILCFSCNVGIGHLADEDRLTGALAYLEHDDELVGLARTRVGALTA